MADEATGRSGAESAARTTVAAGPVSADVSTDHPEAYIARDRRRALAAGRELADRVDGAALFADISGFTPLTEALAAELGPQRGAEELTANIGRVFHAVIDELDHFGGDVIYFSGDAITCWIDGDDGVAAATAALAMLDAIDRTGRIVTPAGTEVRLAMKVAVAVGSARRFVVGDPDVQLIDVLAGRLIDDLAAAEHFAEKGEVVLEPSARASLGDRAELGARRRDDDTGREYAVLAGLATPAQRIDVIEPPPLPEELVRPWLLPAVFERLRTGRGEFLTELRPAIPVFLRFSGIDYDTDHDAARKLDELVRGAQRIMSGYGGNVLQLTLGDKGAYLYGVFGSPIAHEDDAARAAAAALELRDLEQATAAREIQIGITRGRLRSGTYGHPMRRTFVCLGDEVNLSARLMSAAPPGSVFVSKAIQEGAGDAFIWEQLPDMKVKGKAEPVAVYSLKGSLERASRRRIRFELRLVGRRKELAMLNADLADANAGRGRVLGISAEAGMGKSRLVAEFVRQARRRGQLVAFGECQAFGASTAYFAFREVWRRILHLEDDGSQADQIAGLEALLAEIDPALVARAPLLDGVLGLTIPDSELTRSFDAKLRKASLEDLLATCLAARSRDEPLVIVLEDCHWIDELSRDLLRSLARASAGLRVLFVVAYRPGSEPGGGLRLEALPYFRELALDRLDADDAEAVIASKLAQVLGPEATASSALVQLVSDRAEGNPLYIEELISYIAGRGIDASDSAALAGLQLPDSLHTIVLSRIDTVAEAPRRTMKVASVVGRAFEAPVLPGAYPELGTLDVVTGHLETLRAADLVLLDRVAESAYLFKHVTTQEVAYESMPFAMRAMLHGRVGRYLEERDPGGVERQLDLLAHHYWLSDIEDKKREFLARAGDHAQRTYANSGAIVYFERLLTIVEGPERITTTLSLAAVLQRIGDLSRAEPMVVEARTLAVELDDPALVARCDLALAEIARRLGRYDDAAASLEPARRVLSEAGDDALLAEALHLTGSVYSQRGDRAAAREWYGKSLAIREQNGDRAGMAALATNLGIVAADEGDIEAARTFYERGVELYRELGDRRGLGMGNSNLAWLSMQAGQPEAARAYSEEAVRFAREVGDRLNLAIAQNNLGNALRELRESRQAGAEYAAAAQGYLDLDDRWGLAYLLEDVALLAAGTGMLADGFTLLGAANALRIEIGAPRPAAADDELVARLAEARAALGEAAAAEAEQLGSRSSLELAVDRALTLCGPAGR